MTAKIYLSTFREVEHIVKMFGVEIRASTHFQTDRWSLQFEKDFVVDFCMGIQLVRVQKTNLNPLNLQK
ncbi:unnamed protein product [Heterobilharzia americana]|nr:unnamed protein product [Heterobilharzia americana]